MHPYKANSLPWYNAKNGLSLPSHVLIILSLVKMANYGYGFGSSQPQGFSNVHPQSSYTTQVSSGYGTQFGTSAAAPAAAPRQVVQQSFDVGGGYSYGYGRQQDTNQQNSNIQSSHQTTYGTNSYMSRDTGYDASKSGYGYGGSSQGILRFTNVRSSMGHLGPFWRVVVAMLPICADVLLVAGAIILSQLRNYAVIALQWKTSPDLLIPFSDHFSIVRSEPKWT